MHSDKFISPGIPWHQASGAKILSQGKTFQCQLSYKYNRKKVEEFQCQLWINEKIKVFWGRKSKKCVKSILRRLGTDPWVWNSNTQSRHANIEIRPKSGKVIVVKLKKSLDIFKYLCWFIFSFEYLTSGWDSRASEPSWLRPLWLLTKVSSSTEMFWNSLY